MLESYAIKRNTPLRQRLFGLDTLKELKGFDLNWPDSEPDWDLQLLAKWLDENKYSLNGSYEDLLNRMTHGDVIECYNISGALMFGNPHFYRKTSQPVDVHNKSWKTLYKRPAFYSMKCNAICLRAIAQKKEGYIDLEKELGPTILHELGGKKYKIDYRPQLATRIKDKNGMPVGVLILTKAEVLNA